MKMSSDSNQENRQQNDSGNKNNSDAGETNTDKKPLTFKDWKNLKDSQHKPNEKSAKPKNKTKSNNKNNNDGKVNRGNFNNSNGFNGGNGFNSPGGGNFFVANKRLPGFTPTNNFNGMNNFNNNFAMRGNNYGFNNQNGFGFNNFNGPNNFNRSNNFGANSFNNGPNSFGNGRNRFNGPNNGPNLDLLDNFFASDGIYRQKDLMQKPLPPSCNPFRDDQKAEQLLQEFDKSRYTKDDKKKKKGHKKSGEGKKSSNASKIQQMGNGDNNNIMVNNAPKVYVPNPKANIDGKPYIPKPKLPDENLEISKEEKKQQWKEYREAMKPFKNREFYNAKRVVQRLGKKAPSELDEKQLLRLANAREIMAIHKARLTAKYGTYIKASDNSNELGELYVLNKKPPKPDTGYYARPMGKEFQNYGNFGENYAEDHESGRKILGGYSGFQGFVSGGMLEGTATSLYTQTQ